MKVSTCDWACTLDCRVAMNFCFPFLLINLRPMRFYSMLLPVVSCSTDSPAEFNQNVLFWEKIDMWSFSADNVFIRRAERALTLYQQMKMHLKSYNFSLLFKLCPCFLGCHGAEIAFFFYKSLWLRLVWQTVSCGPKVDSVVKKLRSSRLLMLIE